MDCSFYVSDVFALFYVLVSIIIIITIIIIIIVKQEENLSTKIVPVIIGALSSIPSNLENHQKYPNSQMSSAICRFPH